MSTRTSRICCLFVLAISSMVCGGQGDQSFFAKVTDFSDFRPRREMPHEQFVGREACAACHMQKARSQLHTAMANALALPEDNPVLKSHSHLTFQAGRYTYEITTEGQQSVFRVTDGQATVGEPIAYVFGNAHVAQTYVLRHNGKLYEGRVSYFSGIDGLDWTIGDRLEPPPNLEEALGRDIGGDEARNCFSCHGTAAVADAKLHLDRLVPGVTCESCHGPGQSHVTAMRSGTGESLLIFNPRNLAPDQLSQEFCGSCHRSANTVGMMPDLGGIANVRFQPYRLAAGRHDPNDPHFACTACHDPHVDLPLQGASADSKCTVCHAPLASLPKPGGQSVEKPKIKAAGATTAPKSCPVAKSDCDSCHMPKVEIPGTHFKFTDHRIRIVRPGAPYPL